jgi:hypothetical protein
MDKLISHSVKVTYINNQNKMKIYKFREYDNPILFPRISYIINLIEDAKTVLDINITPNLKDTISISNYNQEISPTIH